MVALSTAVPNCCDLPGSTRFRAGMHAVAALYHSTPGDHAATAGKSLAGTLNQP